MRNSIFCFKARLADQKKTGPSELGRCHDQKGKVKGQYLGGSLPLPSKNSSMYIPCFPENKI